MLGCLLGELSAQGRGALSEISRLHRLVAKLRLPLLFAHAGPCLAVLAVTAQGPAPLQRDQLHFDVC